MAAKETKKQVPLRLSSELYDAIAGWAEDDFRSINGQIEYLLTECVRQRRKSGGYTKKSSLQKLDDDESKGKNLQKSDDSESEC